MKTILRLMLLSHVFNKRDCADVSMQEHRCVRFTPFLLCPTASSVNTIMWRPMFTLCFASVPRDCVLHVNDTAVHASRAGVQDEALVLMLVLTWMGPFVLLCAYSAQLQVS